MQRKTAAEGRSNKDVTDRGILSQAIMRSIKRRVNKVIVEQLGVNPEDVKPESSLIDDFGADSVDLIELVMALEEEFDTKISDEDAEKLKNSSNTTYTL